MSNYKAIIDLATDITRGNLTNFSNEEAGSVLHKSILEAVGLTGKEVFSAKEIRKAMNRNKPALYEIIEESIELVVQEGLRDQFEPFVDFRNVAFGDSIVFRRTNPDLFEISTIAGGTNNLRRQRLDGDEFPIKTDWKGVKIYEELERYLAGKVDWVGMINKLQRSFSAFMANDMYLAVKDAYTGLDAPYYEAGSWDIDTFNDLVSHVEAATGMLPMVIGTRKAVQKAEPRYLTGYGGMTMDDRNRDGYFKVIDGITFGILPQSHIPGTDTFAIDEDFLLVIPNGDEKIIKFVTEGETLIKEVNGQENADDSQEYTVRMKYGTGVVATSKYGVYILS